MDGATAVPVGSGQDDQFGSCAKSQMSGGNELLDMSNFLLNLEGVDATEGGASRYGAVVVHPSSAVDIDDPAEDAVLAYNLLVNSTAVHALPVYSAAIKHILWSDLVVI